MRLGGYEFEEISKNKIMADPKIMYDMVKASPFTPYISNNVCIISIKFLREIMEGHTKNKNARVVTGTNSLDKYSFSRDYFIDEDWTSLV